MRVTILFSKVWCIIVLCTLSTFCNAQFTTEIYTDFQGYWKSTSAVKNPVFPDTSHNLLAFKYKNTLYSTSVNDRVLNLNNVKYIQTAFRAMPVNSIQGNTSGTSLYGALGIKNDGVAAGFSTSVYGTKLMDLLMDGRRGLDIGTGVTNLPTTALVRMNVESIDTSRIFDSIPDILFSQIAAIPTGDRDRMWFSSSLTNDADTVGNSIELNWNTVYILGTYRLDLYAFPNNTPLNTATINGVSQNNNQNGASGIGYNATREIRLKAYRLSEFGLNYNNVGNVKRLILKPGGTSDPAFVAYNIESVVVPTPAITTDPVTQTVCPGSTNNRPTFSVLATGQPPLTYQWKKNGIDIPGATSSSYQLPYGITYANLVANSDTVYTVAVTNGLGSVISDPAYIRPMLNTTPSPGDRILATGNSISMSINTPGAFGYQWVKGNDSIPGAISSTYTINAVNTADAGDYKVVIRHPSATSTCVSSPIHLTTSTVLYSQPDVDLNAPSSWGVFENGYGSSPLDFTRTEHTFKVANQNPKTGGNLTIAGTFDLMDSVTTITEGTSFSAGRIIRSGTTGTFANNGSSNITVGSPSFNATSSIYFKAGNNTIRNLNVENSNTLNIGNTLNISAGTNAGTVLIPDPSGVINANGNLVLKSDVNGTARIGISYGTINGNVTVERYIHNGLSRRWHLLSPPTSGQTIYQSWQESGNTTNGFGTMVTNPQVWGFPQGVPSSSASADATNGWDRVSTNLQPKAEPSIKGVNNAGGLEIPLNTNNTSINAYRAWFLFIRGNRPNGAYNNDYTSVATLRSTGPVNQGTAFITNIGSSGNAVPVGNPFASAVSLTTNNNLIPTTGSTKKYYAWDPGYGGTYGGYRLYTSSNGSNYQTLTNGGAYPTTMNSLQSGQAIFLPQGGSGGSVTFQESDKTTSTINVLRNGNSTSDFPNTLVVRLNTGSDPNFTEKDLTYIDFNDNYNNGFVAGEDVVKPGNFNENISFFTGGQYVYMEGRKFPVATDTLALQTWKLTSGNYTFMIDTDIPENGITPYLKDKKINSETQLNPQGSSLYSFSGTAATSGNAYPDLGRFTIVFRQNTTLPVVFKNINAYKKEATIEVQWNVSREEDIKNYEVEKSEDGVSFKTFAMQTAANTLGEKTYTALDENPFKGINYYRVKAIGKDNSVIYTSVVKVNADKNAVYSLNVYPNPVKSGIVNIAIHNVDKGIYSMVLFSNDGKQIAQKQLNITTDNATLNETLALPKGIAKGVYQLRLSKEESESKIIKVVVE